MITRHQKATASWNLVREQLMGGAEGNAKRLKFKVNQRQLQVLSVLGEGGYSRVYQVLEKKRSCLFALKVVDLAKESSVGGGGSSQSETSFMSEIDFLKKFQRYDKIIDLVDYQMKDNNNFRQQNEVFLTALFCLSCSFLYF